MTAPRQFLALAGLALIELFRQPACFLLVGCSCAFTILVPVIVSHQLGQATHLAVDSALAFELVFGVVLAGYAACSTLHNECLSGTILVVFSKPVGRLMFFLAKFTAVSLLVAFFVLCSGLATILAERLAPRNFEIDPIGTRLLLATPLAVFIPPALLNFFRHRPYVPVALVCLALTLLAWILILGRTDPSGQRVAYGSMLAWRLMPACVLEGIALILMVAMALSLAGRLPTPATVAILAVVLFSGLIADYLASRLVSTPPLAFCLRALLPDIQAFWPADRLAGGGTIPLPLIGQASAYALGYGAGVLCLGYEAFRRRQF